MPVVQTATDLQTWYRIDDFTDPWTHAPWIVLMNSVAENSDAWYGQAWQSTIPNSEFLVIANDSFHVAATAPDLAAEAVLKFIDRHEPSSRSRR